MGESKFLYGDIYFVDTNTGEHIPLDDTIVSITCDNIEQFNITKDEETNYCKINEEELPEFNLDNLIKWIDDDLFDNCYEAKCILDFDDDRELAKSILRGWTPGLTKIWVSAPCDKMSPILIGIHYRPSPNCTVHKTNRIPVYPGEHDYRSYYMTCSSSFVREQIEEPVFINHNEKSKPEAYKGGNLMTGKGAKIKSYHDYAENFYAKRIWFNPPYTTVEWFNGEKTTACAEDPEKFSEYNGFAACVAKRLYGSTKNAIDVMNFGYDQAQLPKKLKAKRRQEEKEEKRKIHEELMKHRKWELENAIHKERLARRAKEIVDGEEAEESGS